MKHTILIIIMIIMSVPACRNVSVERESYIRDTTHIIVPPLISDSGKFEKRIIPTGYDSLGLIPIRLDTIWQYTRLNNAKDTIVDIRLFPSTSWGYYKIKPDTIRLCIRDTLNKTEIKKEIIETPFLAKVGIYCFGIITVLIIGLAIYLFNWQRFGKDVSKIS